MNVLTFCVKCNLYSLKCTVYIEHVQVFTSYLEVFGRNCSVSEMALPYKRNCRAKTIFKHTSLVQSSTVQFKVCNICCTALYNIEKCYISFRKLSAVCIVQFTLAVCRVEVSILHCNVASSVEKPYNGFCQEINILSQPKILEQNKNTTGKTENRDTHQTTICQTSRFG